MKTRSVMGQFGAAHGSAADWHSRQVCEAKRLFRKLHGPGDAGSEFEFEAQNASLRSGWMRLAAESENIKSLLRQASLRISEHHAEHLCAWEGMICPVCSRDNL